MSSIVGFDSHCYGHNETTSTSDDRDKREIKRGVDRDWLRGIMEIREE